MNQEFILSTVVLHKCVRITCSLIKEGTTTIVDFGTATVNRASLSVTNNDVVRSGEGDCLSCQLLVALSGRGGGNGDNSVAIKS